MRPHPTYREIITMTEFAIALAIIIGAGIAFNIFGEILTKF